MPDKIFDHLYLGNFYDAQRAHKGELKHLGISHVLNCATELDYPNTSISAYKKLDVDDVMYENIAQHIDGAIEFIELTREPTQGNQGDATEKHACLVHCMAGVSRSSTIVIAYCMKAYKMTLKDAVAFVSQQRPIISPNYGFRTQLIEYERQLYGKTTIDLPADFPVKF